MEILLFPSPAYKHESMHIFETWTKEKGLKKDLQPFL
jgi:hypothetical protein